MITYSNPTANAMLDMITTKAEAGSGVAKIRIYSGEAPIDANTAIGASNVLLAELPCGSPIASAATDNTMTFNTVNSVITIGTGIANFYRLVDSDNNVVVQGTVSDTLGTGAIQLNSIVLYSGYTVTISSATIVLPVHDDGSGGSDGYVDGDDCDPDVFTLTFTLPTTLPTVPVEITDVQSGGNNIGIYFGMLDIPYANGATNPQAYLDNVYLNFSTNSHPTSTNPNGEGIDSLEVYTFFDKFGFYPNSDPQQDFTLLTYIFNSTDNILTVKLNFPPGVIQDGYPLEFGFWGSQDSWDTNNWSITLEERIGCETPFSVVKYMNWELATTSYTAGVTPMYKAWQYFFPMADRPQIYYKRIMFAVSSPDDSNINNPAYPWDNADFLGSALLDTVPSTPVEEYGEIRLNGYNYSEPDLYSVTYAGDPSGAYANNGTFQGGTIARVQNYWFEFSALDAPLLYDGKQFIIKYDNTNWKYELEVSIIAPTWASLDFVNTTKVWKVKVYSHDWQTPIEFADDYNPPEFSPTYHGEYTIEGHTKTVIPLTFGDIDVAEIATQIRPRCEIKAALAPVMTHNGGYYVASSTNTGSGAISLSKHLNSNGIFVYNDGDYYEQIAIAQITRLDIGVAGTPTITMSGWGEDWQELAPIATISSVGGGRNVQVSRGLYWRRMQRGEGIGTFGPAVGQSADMSSTYSDGTSHSRKYLMELITFRLAHPTNPFGNINTVTGSGYPIQATIDTGDIIRGGVLVFVSGDLDATNSITWTNQNGFQFQRSYTGTSSQTFFGGIAYKFYNGNYIPADGLTTAVSPTGGTLYDKIVTTVHIRQMDEK